MNLNRRHTDPLLLGFITLSLLLHLMLLYLAPRRSLMPQPAAEPPVVVEMRPAAPRERELDLPPQPDQPRTEPARRLGPSDRQVERETAPKGEDFEDVTPAATPPKITPTVTPRVVETVPEPEAPVPGPGAVATPEQLPSLEQLLTLPKATTDRMVSEWRTKHRTDVDTGDAVWLDTETDQLFSFFQRFKDGIYRVWNYPPRAAERGEEGVCLLKITMRRDGTVQEVRLVESSGFPLLDNEALAAVRRAAPYGALPRSYAEDELNIFAFFRYNLVRRNRSIF
jgi:protein TonB